MADAPEVAVVVGDFGRRRYLARAVASVTSQSIARSRYELVVTKNYRDPDLDRSLENDGALVRFDEERGIGRWFARAAAASRAPVVAFLDDDDEFEPDRLERLLSVLAERPEVGLYRNRVSVIDADGRPVPRARWRSHERDDAFDALGPVTADPRSPAAFVDLAFRRTSATFNLSSIAVRRELLAGDGGAAFEATMLPDQALYLAAVLAGRPAFLDDRRLTRYRYYPGNVTHEVPWLGRAEVAYRDMAEVAGRHGAREVADWLREQSVHYGRMFRGSSLVQRVAEGAGRREVGGRTAEYLRYLARHPRERQWTLDTWAAGVYGVGYVPLGPVIARLARSRLAARSDG